MPRFFQCPDSTPERPIQFQELSNARIRCRDQNTFESAWIEVDAQDFGNSELLLEEADFLLIRNFTIAMFVIAFGVRFLIKLLDERSTR